MMTLHASARVAVALALAGVALTPSSSAAQAGDPAPPAATPPAGRVGGPPPEPVDLVFDREVFTYPTFERANPFRPLSGAETGPRFENLVLRGRILDALDPSRSIALIETRAVGGSQAQGGQSFRVRVGEVLGNTRILEIRDQEVVVEVEDFGVFEVRTLQLVRTAPRATPPPPGTLPGGTGVPGPGDTSGAGIPGAGSGDGAQGFAGGQQPNLVGARVGPEEIPRFHAAIVNGGRS